MSHFKIAGVLLILSAGLFGVFYASATERKRLLVLDAWIELIGLIRGQIDCFLTPLGDILKLADKQLLSHLSSGTDRRDLSALLNDSAPYLDPDCYRYLSALVRSLGSGYREDQIRACDYCTEQLRKRREELGRQLPARVKTQGTLILCAAIGLALLLW